MTEETFLQNWRGNEPDVLRQLLLPLEVQIFVDGHERAHLHLEDGVDQVLAQRPKRQVPQCLGHRVRGHFGISENSAENECFVAYTSTKMSHYTVRLSFYLITNMTYRQSLVKNYNR